MKDKKSNEKLYQQIKLNKALNLDDRDSIIVSLIQKKPSISQQELARKLNLSQPSVGARIKKLQEKGIINNICGINFRKINLSFAKIDVNTTNTKEIIKEFKDCPFFINALITSGRFNVCFFFMALDIYGLEEIVNHHLRGNSMVKELEMNIIITTAKDFIHPLNIDIENQKQLKCDLKCTTKSDDFFES